MWKLDVIIGLINCISTSCRTPLDFCFWTNSFLWPSFIKQFVLVQEGNLELTVNGSDSIMPCCTLPPISPTYTATYEKTQGIDGGAQEVMKFECLINSYWELHKWPTLKFVSSRCTMRVWVSFTIDLITLVSKIYI